MFTDAAAQPDAFYERSGRSLQRVGQQLSAWARGSQGGAAAGAVLERLQGRLDTLCRALPAGDSQRATCEKLLAPPADTQKSA